MKKQPLLHITMDSARRTIQFNQSPLRSQNISMSFQSSQTHIPALML